MKKGTILTFLMLFVTVIGATAQTPLWQGKGRIVISSDGNEHDKDDWSATPMTLALIAAKGLQDKVALYTYCDHIWGSNQETLYVEKKQTSAYEQMRESVRGSIKYFGYDASRFICAVDNPEVAYKAMVEQINLSSEENPLIIIAAGPMQVVGESINRAESSRRKFVTVLSHAIWNNNHSNTKGSGKKWWDNHTGWTFDMMKKEFEKDGAKFIYIASQNGGEGYQGMYAPKAQFDWVLNSAARDKAPYKKGSWDWLYKRLEVGCKERGKVFDPSDAGMVLYLFTGVEKTDPSMAKEIMENPVL